MLELRGRKVLVLGLGDTGLSMARWLVRQGADVRVADSREAPPCAATLAEEMPQVPVATGAFQKEDLRGVDLIAISPGIDRRKQPIAEAGRHGVPIVGDIELFAQAVATSPDPVRILGITGTNGKSTVTAMAGEMCRAAGLATIVAGNIGLPALDALAATSETGLPEVFVLELSSFQLESTRSLNADAAVVLNVCEDHLDRYAGMSEYAAAKARIFAGSGVQVLNRDDRRSMDMARAGRRIVTFGLDAPATGDDWGISSASGRRALVQGEHEWLALDELPLTGLHNAANALAACALARSIDLPEAPLVAALREFKGLPHRVQKIAAIGGIGFYDDSKGTNVGATAAALSGMSQPVVLIAGGDGKGQDFAPLADPVREHARAVILMGRDAETIASALAGCGVPLIRARGMEEAVEAAHRAGLPGDAVLLSPACASFDMFRNYIHRGEAFASAVGRLAERRR